MPRIGDKSDEYRALRQEFDELFPRESEVLREKLVNSLRRNKYESIDDFGYDIYNCPLYPPDNYPLAFSLVDGILKNWPADDTRPRKKIFNSLCVFDYDIELDKARNYQQAEVPFVIRNDPDVHRTVERWNHPDYLLKLLKEEKFRSEYSENNHFMYWNPPRNPKNKIRQGLYRLGGANGEGAKPWVQPTKIIQMSYPAWLQKANVTDESKLGPDNPHWYFRLIGCGHTRHCGGTAEYLFDELPFFQPRESIYLVEPMKQKGIHCRFGMKGVIAENHFDASRNMIVVLGGERRYILSHPDQCPLLALLPKGHPSGRHSAVDWSDPDLETYPEFKQAKGNEVVMQAGDALYLPTNWFHYIISLNLNFQCNTRSGRTDTYSLSECGF